jgi:hypothetical protein
MSHRIATKKRVISAAIAAFGLSAFAFAPAFAQAQTKTCTHEGRAYKSGDKLTIGGKGMVCDGATGTWVTDQG